MSKYVDSEKLIAELTRMQFDLNAAYRHPQSDSIVRAISLEYDDILSLVDSLQQEQQEKKEVKFVFPKFLYARTTNNKTIDVSYAPQSLDAIEYIRSDSLQQEQPEVDLEKEIRDTCRGYRINDYHEQELGKQDIENIAHYFYELGLKARKED